MKLILKIVVMAIIFLPTLVLTGLIWLFGGWTKGWDYMPNPVYKLIGWIEV